jgi:hypothetical protein
MMPLQPSSPALLRFAFLLLLFQIIPQSTFSQYSPDENDVKNFKLTVVVLTMNRPNSLARLLNSIHNTDFENDDDRLNVEIHVDKSLGLHYNACVE